LSKLIRFIRRLPIISQLDAFAHKVYPPGFKGISVGEVYDYYILALRDSSILERAYSASFKFFMGLFPGLIFLMTLIPHLPIPNIQSSLIITLENMMPAQIFPLVEKTVVEVISKKNTGLLSFGFFIAMIFSTNGMNGIMRAFNDSALITETRKPLKQRLHAAGLTFLEYSSLDFLFLLQYRPKHSIRYKHKKQKTGK